MGQEERDEVVNQFSVIHETELRDEDYLINYDPTEVYENKFDLKTFILSLVSTTGSALGSGKYAGHGFALKWYDEFRDCEWIVKKHIDWNHNVSQILIPVKKGVINYPDDVEKIDYRMMLQKILRVENPKVEDIKEHIKRLLDNYSQPRPGRQEFEKYPALASIIEKVAFGGISPTGWDKLLHEINTALKAENSLNEQVTPVEVMCILFEGSGPSYSWDDCIKAIELYKSYNLKPNAQQKEITL